jgi:hypothetical protein
MISVDALGSRGWQVTGLVPDGVSDVRVTAGGEPQPIALVNNVFSSAVPSTPTRLIYVGPDHGSRTVSFAHLND